MNSAATERYRTNWSQTWRNANGTMRQWSFHAWLINVTNMYPLPSNGDTVQVTKLAVEQHPKIPLLRKRDGNLWMFPRAVLPVILQWIYYLYSGNLGHRGWVFAWYFVWFKITGISAIRLWHELGERYGYLDGGKQRNGVPDDSTNKIYSSLTLTAIIRTTMMVLLAYSPETAPALQDFCQLLLQLAFYPIVLDFWFYLYHRAMHEFNALWKFHRTHHLAKHPNSLLTLFADVEQELFDILVVPLLAYLTMRQLPLLKMNFYQWWVCSMYQAVIEVGGHSGVRIYAGSFTAGFGILEPLGLNLIIEDHDLHHRKGYRTSGNYGKQTRLWDRLFGTVIPREECRPDQVDRRDVVQMPW